MQDQAKQMRGTFEASRNKYSGNKRTNYQSDKKKPSTKELHHIIEEAVNRAINNPKRKHNEDEEQLTVEELCNLDLSDDEDKMMADIAPNSSME